MSRIFEGLHKASYPVSQIVSGAPEEAGKIAESDAGRPYPVPLLPRRLASTEEIRTISFRLSGLIPLAAANSAIADRYRILRTRIVQNGAQPRSILVSSPGEGDGKTTTAVNLAITLALRSEANVLLIDADLRKGTVGKAFGLENCPGLGELLSGSCERGEAIVECAQLPHLHVMPAGRAHANPSELLDSQLWRNTVSTLRNAYEFIVIDSPPADAFADFDLLKSSVDSVLLVFRPDTTSRQRAMRLVRSIAKGKVLGVVMNGLSGRLSGEVQPRAAGSHR